MEIIKVNEDLSCNPYRKDGETELYLGLMMGWHKQFDTESYYAFLKIHGEPMRKVYENGRVKRIWNLYENGLVCGTQKLRNFSEIYHFVGVWVEDT